MRRTIAGALLCALLGAGTARAEAEAMTLAADARLEASGLLAFVVPRFALKTGVRVRVVPGDPAALERAAADGTADAVIVPRTVTDALAGVGVSRGLRPVFHTEDPAEGGAYFVAALDGGAAPGLGARFAEWMSSGPGRRTIEQFSERSGVAYLPGAGTVAAPVAAPPRGDARAGESLALVHCGRCHVVSDRNRFAGIGSTPSFAALRTQPNWLAKFRNFFAENPHPSFTQVEGVTPPFDPARPPYLAPVEITLDDLDAIVAYAGSLRPRDLGADIEMR